MEALCVMLANSVNMLGFLFQFRQSRTTRPFELIHCDLWTSPLESISGFKYFLVILDDFTHYLWTFPLRHKSDTFAHLSNLHNYVSTQFSTTVAAIQCDNNHEFDNTLLRNSAATHGTLLQFSCPYTSQQNDKAERVIRTFNDIVRSLLFQASMPPHC